MIHTKKNVAKKYKNPVLFTVFCHEIRSFYVRVMLKVKGHISNKFSG